MIRTISLSLCLGFLGCLLPPPGDEIDSQDNQAPQIILESLSPSPLLGPVNMYPDCEPYEFFARLTDPDNGALYWKVFLDYFSDTLAAEREINQLTITNDDPAPVIAFLVAAEDERFTLHGHRQEPHIIELLVSDQPFFTDQRRPIGRSIAEGGKMDSFTWTVELREGTCPIR